MNTTQNVNLNEIRILVSLEILKKKKIYFFKAYNAREIVVKAMLIFCLNNLSMHINSISCAEVVMYHKAMKYSFDVSITTFLSIKTLNQMGHEFVNF